MATGKEFLLYVLDQLSGMKGLTYRQMMGEFILYVDGRIAAYLCDDRLLVKPVPAALRLLPKAPWEAPYEGAKEMLLVEQVDDREFLQELFTAIYPELPLPKGRKK